MNDFSNKKFVIYSKENLVPMMTVKPTIKVWDHCHYIGNYRGAAHNICNPRYKTSKEIPVVFHNISKYGHHFIIKKSAEKFEGLFESLEENTEKYTTFSVPTDKELENDKATTLKIKV